MQNENNNNNFWHRIGKCVGYALYVQKYNTI